MVIGVPVAGRTHVHWKDQVGYFLNMLPLRTRFRRRRLLPACAANGEEHNAAGIRTSTLSVRQAGRRSERRTGIPADLQFSMWLWRSRIFAEAVATVKIADAEIQN